MARILAAVMAGVFIGVVATSLITWGGGEGEPLQGVIRSDSTESAAVLQIVAAGNVVVADSEVSVEKIRNLPSAFDRSTALHILASQSDAAEVQDLIFQTHETVDEFERDRLLELLFSRLTEIQPRAALQLARSETFAGVKSLERAVWRSWAHADFDDALFEAKTQTSNIRQKAAAQSLYLAFGYLGNEKTERIEDELGIGPDRLVRGRFIHSLADQSIADAIDFINAVEDESERGEYASWLAHYVSADDPHAAVAFAGRFQNEAAGKNFERIVQRTLIQEDPHAAIERLQAAGKAVGSNSEFHSAISALVKIDMAAALALLEQSRSPDARRTLSSAIASRMAKEDPEAALEWARGHKTEFRSMPMMSVLHQIARSDPQLALAEAVKADDGYSRGGLVSSIVSQIAQKNPQEAAALLAQIQSERHKLEASQALTQTWMRSDPDAAINWIQGQDDELQENLMQMAATQIARRDIDAAMRLLPRLDENIQPGIRQQIAQQLAMTGSVEEARNFIRQFDGQPGFGQLQATVIAGVAHTDAIAAKQMADQLSAGDARDQAYVQVISRRAQDDPADAIRWLANIGNETLRGSATGQIASLWARQDAMAAERWVTGLPPGSSRDVAIMHMASLWQKPSEAQRRLVNSIENRDMRGQAKIRWAYGLARTDFDKARELLKDDDIPEFQRQQAELMLNRIRAQR